MNPRADRTELRLKLLANGFEPLANKNKICLLPEWSTFTIDEARIQSWHRSRAFSDTGLRCGDLIAVDLDIDDENLLNRFADILVSEKIVGESLFVRIGRPPREMWLYRATDKIGKRTSGMFVPKGTDAVDPKPEHCQVEVLGRGCQIGAFGQHSDEFEYTWPEQSPLDHDLKALPPITLAQVERVIERAVAFFTAEGWEQRTRPGGTEEGFSRVYDLTPDMDFDVKDEGTFKLDELEALLIASPGTDFRVHVNALRPTSGSWAGLASYVEGSVCINDFGEYKAHFPASLDFGARLTELGQLLEQRRPKQATEKLQIAATTAESHPITPTQDFETNLGNALKRFAYVQADSRVADLDRNVTMPLQEFRDAYANIFKTEPTKNGEKLIKLGDAWHMSQRLHAHRAEMRPDQPQPMFTEAGDLVVNTYRTPAFPVGGYARPGHEFMSYLLPLEDERRWVMQWLSFKLQHPAVRGPAVFMVAPGTYGTGRGTFFRLLTLMFGGPRWVRTISFATLTGRTYQSQYNDFMSDSLIITVNEAKEVDTGTSRWQQRANAYEHLKEMIDPGETTTQILRKGLGNTQGRVFASICVASNHTDALAIPLNDRRIAVVENGQNRPDTFWEQFNHWMADPANVGAFVNDMRDVDLTGYNPYAAPPVTGMKREMISNGESDFDRALHYVIATAPGALMVREQAMVRLVGWMNENSYDFPDNWEKMLFPAFTRATRPFHNVDRVTIEKKQRPVRMLRQPTRSLTSVEAVLEEIKLNGPLSFKIGEGGQVIDFMSRKAL